MLVVEEGAGGVVVRVDVEEGVLVEEGTGGFVLVEVEDGTDGVLVAD